MSTRETLLVLAVTAAVVMFALVGLIARPAAKPSTARFHSPAGVLVFGR